jgi:hypothetical protein
MAPSVTTFPGWPKGLTAWPSQQRHSVLLRYDPDPEYGGFSFASNKDNIDQITEGLSQALSRLPACGDKNRERQRNSGMGGGGLRQRKEAMIHIRESFAEDKSGFDFFEGIHPADWRRLKDDPHTVVLYPAWHLHNSEVYNHPSSIPPESRLQRSCPLSDFTQTTGESPASRTGTAGSDRFPTTALGKRGAQDDFETPYSKRSATDGPPWRPVATMDSQGQSLDGDTEMGDV